MDNYSKCFKSMLGIYSQQYWVLHQIFCLFFYDFFIIFLLFYLIQMLMKRNFMATSQQKKSAMSIEKSDKLQNSDNNKSQIIDCDNGNKKKS